MREAKNIYIEVGVKNTLKNPHSTAIYAYNASARSSTLKSGVGGITLKSKREIIKVSNKLIFLPPRLDFNSI